MNDTTKDENTENTNQDNATGEVGLLGSDVQPAVQTIGDKDYQLGELVLMAHQESGLTAEDWNATPAEEIEAKIQAVVDRLKTEAGEPVETSDNETPAAEETPAENADNADNTNGNDTADEVVEETAEEKTEGQRQERKPYKVLKQIPGNNTKVGHTVLLKEWQAKRLADEGYVKLPAAE